MKWHDSKNGYFNVTDFEETKIEMTDLFQSDDEDDKGPDDGPNFFENPEDDWQNILVVETTRFGILDWRKGNSRVAFSCVLHLDMHSMLLLLNDVTILGVCFCSAIV